jgi:hypothetical protein
VKYRVNLRRAVEQFGFIELEAGSVDEARDWALRLSELPGAVTLQPTWTEDVRLEPATVIGIMEAA